MNASSQITERETNFLRALAMILIINSHLDNYYPVRHLATGGMIGNALFLMLSSLGLYLSWHKKGQEDLAQWYGRRMARIYPSTWICVLMLMYPIAVYEKTFSPGNYLELAEPFFFPPFWFLQVLLIFYVVIYFILKHHTARLIGIFSVSALLVYVIYYVGFLDTAVFSIEDYPLRLVFYFLVMLYGTYLATHAESIRSSGFLDWVLLFLCGAGIYLHKYVMHSGHGSSFQFVQHLLVFPLLYYSLKVSRHAFVERVLMKDRSISGRLITFLSGTTLELYMVQELLQTRFGMASLGFPSNAVVFVGSSTILAVLISFLSRPLRKRLVQG